MTDIQKPGLLRRLRLDISMVRYGCEHNHDFAREHYTFFSGMQNHLKKYTPKLEGHRVLDVGCGKSYWLTLLLHSVGVQVTGIDTEVTEPGFNPGKYLRILLKNGLKRVARTLVWDLFFARSYYSELQKVAAFPLRFEGVDTRPMSVTELDFQAQTFDLVVSYEVFEHLPNIPAALSSLRRVMKPEGITYLCIHNFTSLSGGHHIAWKYPDSKPSTIVPPWDHLRQNRFPDIPSFINRLREKDYRQEFEKQFDILEWFTLYTEGEKLLTPEIRAELNDYSPDELIMKEFVVIARPKNLGLK